MRILNLIAILLTLSALFSYVNHRWLHACQYPAHLSGPIAIVVAGLLIGNPDRRLAMSEKTRQYLDTFWELVDEILNAVLFALIGLEILVLAFTQ